MTKYLIPEFRNPARNRKGTIDCDINHPDFGWIPFTCNPDDDTPPVDSAALYDAIETAGNVADYTAPVPSADPSDYLLTRYQLRSELVSRGRNAAYIKGLIDALTNDATKEQLYVDLEDKQSFNWNDDLIVLLRANMGGNNAQQAAVWIAASSR